MLTEKVSRMRILVPFFALFLAAACGGGGSDVAAVEETPSAATADIPDACTFFSRAELEQTVGWQLDEGESEELPAGFSKCDFDTPPRIDVTRTFPDPALPQSVGFSSLLVSTHISDAQSFDEFRQMLGPDAEDAPGIGDGAYFYGPDMLYVRVGNRGFSLRIHTDAASDADWARVREVMLTLARLGASRLG